MISELLWIGFPVVLAQVCLVLWGMKKLRSLSDVIIDTQTMVPVSVVVAARNEEAGLPAALAKLSSIQGDSIEFIVVNDRSTDQTAQIIAEWQGIDARIRTINVAELPAGWLGKNHAMHIGAQQCRHEFILFTDADVLHSGESIQKSLQYCVQRQLDFFSLLIRIDSRSLWVRLFVSFFSFSFSSFFRPWQSSNPKSKAAVGVGAFLMVRKSFYDLHGGHQTLAMRPDDDVTLAKYLKSCGGRLDVLVDVEHTSVEWYPSLIEAARGLEKNSLAGLNYSFALWALSMISCATFFVLAPLWGLFTLSPVGLSYYIMTSLTGALAATRWKQPWYYAFAYPLSALFFVLIVVRAGILTAWRGGIFWRGRFYSLKELRSKSLR